MTQEEHGMGRLHELRGWADYIFESLTLDQEHELAKIAQLERLVGPRGIKELREQAFVLRDRLHVLIVEAESRMPVAV